MDLFDKLKTFEDKDGISSFSIFYNQAGVDEHSVSLFVKVNGSPIIILVKKGDTIDKLIEVMATHVQAGISQDQAIEAYDRNKEKQLKESKMYAEKKKDIAVLEKQLSAAKDKNKRSKIINELLELDPKNKKVKEFKEQELKSGQKNLFD